MRIAHHALWSLVTLSAVFATALIVHAEDKANIATGMMLARKIRVGRMGVESKIRYWA